jgi:hypothetical protein
MDERERKRREPLDEGRGRRGSPVEAVRAFGITLGGSAVLVTAASWSVVACARAAFAGRRPSRLAVAGAGGLVGYLLVVRPWLLSWGATANERSSTLPGDELVDRPGIQTTRAVTVEAPVEEVWPWLAQIGQDRGGFYSYEWLENLAGCEMHNADRVHPEWQERTVGETVPLHPLTGLKLARFEPPSVYTFEGWYFVLEPQEGDDHTRLIARGRCRSGLVSVAYALLLELPHFVMERKMLLGIKARAERSRAPAETVSGLPPGGAG